MELYESRKGQQKKHDAFVRRIFPGGNAQQEKNVQILAQLLPKGEASVNKYMLITARDILTNDDDDEDRAKELRTWYGGKMAQYLKPPERALVYAMAQLTVDCTLEDYPDLEAIKARGNELFIGEMFGWPVKAQSRFNLKKIFARVFTSK